MKILVTGGAGFIGGNFVHYMVETYPEDMIVNLDLLTYAGNLETCKPVEGKPNYKFVKGDIADREFIFKLFEEEKFDVVVNFAAESHVDRSITDPEIFVKTNVMGTTTLLDAAKEFGVKRYHHNLETSRNYYDKICRTHSYEERVKTIKNAKEAGLEVCSGGIIGLGETIIDRIDLAITLRELEIKSIPINILSAIKGTKLQHMTPLNEEEILRTIAVFRFINPEAKIRLAGGRYLLKNFGENAFKAGANATITGNLLTTCGNKIKDDKRLIENIGMRIF